MHYFFYFNTYLLVVLLFAALEFVSGRFRLKGVTKNDAWLDFASFLQSTVVIGPLVAFGAAWAAAHLWPASANALITTPVWLQVLAFLLLEDMVQYWWHRSAHTFPAMWRLHLPHHMAPYMGTRMIYRNGLFFGLLMPNLWIASFLVYLGFGEVYFFYAIVKAVVTVGAHSELRWDRWLYRYRVLHPVAWLVERTISTPATHFAHHAASEADGIGHYNGNYGNLLFFWDVLYGTARITRRYPPAFGIEAAEERAQPWWRLLLYPLVSPRQKPAPVVSRTA